MCFGGERRLGVRLRRAGCHGKGQRKEKCMSRKNNRGAWAVREGKETRPLPPFPLRFVKLSWWKAITFLNWPPNTTKFKILAKQPIYILFCNVCLFRRRTKNGIRESDEKSAGRGIVKKKRWCQIMQDPFSRPYPLFRLPPPPLPPHPPKRYKRTPDTVQVSFRGEISLWRHRCTTDDEDVEK